MKQKSLGAVFWPFTARTDNLLTFSEKKLHAILFQQHDYTYIYIHQLLINYETWLSKGIDFFFNSVFINKFLVLPVISAELLLV